MNQYVVVIHINENGPRQYMMNHACYAVNRVDISRLAIRGRP